MITDWFQTLCKHDNRLVPDYVSTWQQTGFKLCATMTTDWFLCVIMATDWFQTVCYHYKSGSKLCVTMNVLVCKRWVETDVIKGDRVLVFLLHANCHRFTNLYRAFFV